MDKLTDVDVRERMIDRFLIAGDSGDERLRECPHCPLLWHHRIAHTGFQTTGYPYELTRSYQSGSCMVATVAGVGEVLIDGEWEVLRSGEACLLPPYAFNSIRALEGEEWSFVWVKYLEDLGSQPVVTAMSPVHGKFDPEPLKHAIYGLHAASVSGECLSAQNLWVELIHRYVVHFARPKVEDERLWRVWTEVEKRLGYAWSLEEMAGLAHMSKEQLRRLCRRQFGRSPKQQVTYLRMRRARYLLGATRMKVATIAAQLGYADSQTFTKVFKKFNGINPSGMR
ncbi:helix-turn-helix domain-containing protein [Rubritalea tangerina]|uniref:Helix-turn-helix transcriptional regulator n=1 Tax=Rubritalea tangerina TaxID=430798 RepID=A0ABW4Z5Q4_9BACT